MSPPSRDAKILYDWRARPVVVIEEAVGYSGSTLDNGKFISATSTVFDNLDRPIFVATWGSNNIPDVEDHVEYWAEMFTGDYAAADIASAILSHGIGPVTLSHTIYDERGRPFEQRSYDVTDNTASTYQFTKTYRDDLNRVLGELSPSGFTENTYDSLGRVTETSHWSQQDANDQTQGAGVELTRSQTQYDIFGNVEVQISYDRLDINGGPGPITYTATRNAAGGLDPIPSPSTSNAIITYTYNWYDNAKRLKATAYWGNAGTDLFTNGAPPVYSTINEPRWIAGATPEDEDYYKIDTVDVTGKAIVTRYGYDVQGRRIWSQDAKGIVSRTWYDLLGRTILQAENWNDNELFAFGGLATLTPNHSGQTRYTAHHFTRGGLNDLMVAIRQNFEGANITPGMIAWASGDINNDFAATTASLPGVGGSVQATHFVYGTPNIVSEIVNAEAAPHGGADPISTFRPLVSEIWYPDESGVPNANDAVKFTYTTSGQIASRTDQRGVTLEYEYGTIGSGAGLTAVRAVEPASPPIGFADYYDGYVNRLVFTRQHGRLTTANSKAVLAGGTASRSDLTFQYDGWGNLLSEYQKSSGPQSGTASYLWEENPATQNGSRLAEIQYPSGRRIRYDYGINDPAQTGETEDFINRVTGITGLTAAGAVDYHYTNNEYTGGGRKLSQEFGNPASPLIVQSFKPDAGVFKPAGLDRFGRITDLSFENATTATTYPGNLIHNYQYGYDPNGNREFARVTQASFTITTPNGGLKTSLAANPRAQKVGGGTTTTESHDNVESYLYGYDELNRLLYAEKGALDGANTDLDYNKPREGQAWELDTLGNWSKGGTGRWLYTPETGIDAKPGRDPFDTDIERQNHIIQKHNQINIAERYKPVDPNNPVAPNDPSLELEIEQFHYDPAGNLKQDAVRKYRYDAWGRLAEVRLVSTGSRVVTYRYDALGRRIAKDIPTSFSAALDTHLTGDLFFYAGDRVIELRHAYDDALPHKRIEQPGLPLTLGSQFASSAKKDSSPHQIDDPKLATQQAVGGDYTYDTRKEFVWGLDYIDEQVGVISHVNSTDYLEYTLQDANYNVVANVYDYGGNPSLTYQYRYDPYGGWSTFESGSDGTDIPFSPSDQNLPHVHSANGLYFDQETGMIYNRGRYRKVDTGGYISKDPNGQALLVSGALRQNAATPMALAGFSAAAMYGDGMSPYEFVGSNPITGKDPTGLFQGYQGLVRDVLVAGTTAYAIALDMATYSLLEDDLYSDRFDRAIEAVPYVVGSSIAGGLIAWSTGGSALGAGVASGLTSHSLGYGFKEGFNQGFQFASTLNAALLTFGNAKRGAVIGITAAGTRSSGGVLRVLRNRGMLPKIRYTAKSRAHIRNSNHHANSPARLGKSRFKVGEGGSRFTDEVTSHPDVKHHVQSDGKIRFWVDDMGRVTGKGTKGQDVRGGRVVVEGAEGSRYWQPGEVVTQFPQ